VLGDLQRFVPMGRERIADASADKSGVHLEVILSQNEPSVSLTCYTESPISAAGADAAAVTNLRRDASTGLCTFTIQLDAQLAAKADFDKTVHIASIVLAPPSAN